MIVVLLLPYNYGKHKKPVPCNVIFDLSNKHTGKKHIGQIFFTAFKTKILHIVSKLQVRQEELQKNMKHQKNETTLPVCKFL